MPFRCSSNVKQQTKSLVEAYAALLRSGNADDTSAAFAKLGVSSAEDIPNILGASLTLTQCAFLPEPQYFFPAGSLVPVHCRHLDLVTEVEIEDACQNGAPRLSQLFAQLVQPESLAFSFLDFSTVDEFASAERLHRAFLFFVKLSRLEGVNAVFGDLMLRMLHSLPQLSPAVTVYGTVMPKAQLEARCLALAFLAGEAMTVDQRGRLLQLLSRVEPGVEAALIGLLSRLPADAFGSLVDLLQNALTLELIGSCSDPQLATVAKVMAMLFAANFTAAPRSGVVSYARFYSGYAHEFDEEQMQKDFVRRLREESSFSFCKFPFMIDPGFKSMVLQLEAMVAHDGAIQRAMVSNMFGPHSNPLQDHFLFLRIERPRLIESTLKELRLRKEHVRRPVRIQFVGEEGVDEGGLKKEFFQLVVKELLDPNYNMFREVEGANTLWFTPSVVNSTSGNEYFLIGQVLGIAVYNNVILDVSFPPALFRKLLGVPTTLEDLGDIDPGLASGLGDLLAFIEGPETGTVEDLFCRNFVYEHDVFGSTVEQPLVPGGEGISLTGSNRQTFVDAVTTYVLDRAIEGNFRKFYEGFHSVCDGKMITDMRPEELEQLVRGCPTLDFAELQASTRYDGYRKSDPVIQHFWDIVVHEFTVEHKKQFLKFCTGSDRVPIRGLKDLRFIIGRNGDDSDLLPTSHTCFNHLLLPAYMTKQKLHDKLLLAISNCQGFGLR